MLVGRVGLVPQPTLVAPIKGRTVLRELLRLSLLGFLATPRFLLVVLLRGGSVVVVVAIAFVKLATVGAVWGNMARVTTYVAVDILLRRTGSRVLQSGKTDSCTRTRGTLQPQTTSK